MKTVPLKEVVQIVKSGVKPFDGEKAYVDTSSVEGNKIVGEIENTTYGHRKSRANMEVQVGDVLFAKMADTRKTLLIQSDNSSNIYSTGFFVVRPNPTKLRTKYLYYWLRFEGTELLKDRLAHGETQKQLNNTQLKNKFCIPIPDLPQQDEWISKFEKIDSILNRLQKQKEIAYNLLMSEREDSLRCDPKDYLPLEKIVKSPPYRYPTFYGFKYVKEGVPVLKISNMTPEAKFPTDKSLYDHITEEINSRYPKTIVQENDLVMEARGTYIGKTALVPSELSGANISPNTIRISLNTEKIIPTYFWHYTFTSQWNGQIEKITRYWKLKFGTIRADRLKKVMVPVPKLKTQEKVVEHLETIDSI